MCISSFDVTRMEMNVYDCMQTVPVFYYCLKDYL